jgi:acyl-CoA synthetase (AMP-forming)/AMP-acid ligase II
VREPDLPPNSLRSLDLSNWRVAYNGAEPVRKQTLDRFAKAFAVCGFSPQQFLSGLRAG